MANANAQSARDALRRAYNQRDDVAFEKALKTVGEQRHDEYAIAVRHPGFVETFLISLEPPSAIGGGIWNAFFDEQILRFRRREAAEDCIRKYQLHFAAANEPQYSFVLMKLDFTPMWVEDARPD